MFSFGQDALTIGCRDKIVTLPTAAIPEQSALTIAEKFVVHFVVTFGCPLEVHTDQGRNFDGNLFKSLCTILEVAKTRTTPYHPSSNGQNI
jgi:hypothetical protein